MKSNNEFKGQIMRLKILAVIIKSSAVAVLTLVFSIGNFLNAQTTSKDADWYKKLYEKDVVYEDFACSVKDKDSIKEYFKNHPLMEILPICHNDCPIIKCRPVVPFPSIAKAVRVTGTASVHVLVNEEGRTIYARILIGHPLIRESVKKAACETQFREYGRKQQGVMHFSIDNYVEINVPSRANIVSQ